MQEVSSSARAGVPRGHRPGGGPAPQPDGAGRDLVRDSNLLSVGLTRATDHLAVTWVRRSAFTERVMRSNKAIQVSDTG